MLTLEEMIAYSKDSREIKRAISVKLVTLNVDISKIEEALQVSDSFISKWKILYETQGAEALLLKYKGSLPYLDKTSRKQVVSFLQQQERFSVEELRDDLETQYHVIYKSKQSYYELLKEGGLSWKKNQKVNPKKKEALIEQKRKDIQNYLNHHQSEIESGSLTVFIIDECHLLWGDSLGYIWGKRNAQIEIPIQNQKQRQTYYGAVNNSTGELFLKAYPCGNGLHTVSFIKELYQTQKSKLHLGWCNLS